GVPSALAGVRHRRNDREAGEDAELVHDVVAVKLENLVGNVDDLHVSPLVEGRRHERRRLSYLLRCKSVSTVSSSATAGHAATQRLRVSGSAEMILAETEAAVPARKATQAIPRLVVPSARATDATTNMPSTDSGSSHAIMSPCPAMSATSRM